MTTRLTAHAIYLKLENDADLGYYRGGCIDVNQELDRLYAAAEQRDQLLEENKRLLDELQDRCHGLDLLQVEYEAEERRADRWERAARKLSRKFREQLVYYDNLQCECIEAQAGLTVVGGMRDALLAENKRLLDKANYWRERYEDTVSSCEDTVDMR